MSVVRKHEAINQRINEQHERKALKEEQNRLARIQQMTFTKKRKPSQHSVNMDYDFSDLELRVACFYANSKEKLIGKESCKG